MTNRYLPGSTIGILGGGQLGRMISLAGRAMGYRFVTLDPTPDAPCGQVADQQIVAPYTDMDAARQLAELADVITYEFENVDAQVAALLEETSDVPQGSKLLYTTQHRLREKDALQQAGVPVAPYYAIRSPQDLDEALQQIGLPAVLKTTVGGYDGKGQRVLRKEADVERAWEELREAGELVWEQFIPFEKEISVIAARNPDGEIRTFPVAENVHVENILHLSVVPARISKAAETRAESLAKRIAEELDVVGLIAVEMFLTKAGDIYVNELAPRPHNSGHYTMEACTTSQFEQHLRAICNLPLGPVQLLSPVVMVNVLGEHVAPLLDWMAAGGEAKEAELKFNVHLYGKKEVKHKRKMGHINILTPDVEKALAWIEASPIWKTKESIRTN